MSQSDLGDLLAGVLPSNVKITVRHISSTPTPCAALFAAPPGESPELTFCENHFLAVSVDVRGDDGQEQRQEEVIVFGIEALVYSTANLTTIFVSKADSTGYLHLLLLNKIAPTIKVSLLRLVSTAFLSYLVRTRQRPGVRLVLSLFARAQDQYLFPGSIDNSGKHVLDDRGLVKWWCRVVDPILRERESESKSHDEGASSLDHQSTESTRSSATAYLIVPGCDKFETRGFFPSTAKFNDDKDNPRWVNGYPLQQLCGNPNAPPRCLVPRLPDDPKTRFLADLDYELPKQEAGPGLSDLQNAGQWKSVKTLEGFWEMMAYRQECSAGRLVGFLWLVVNPPGLVNSSRMETQATTVVGEQPFQPPAASSNHAQEKVVSQLSGTSSDHHDYHPFFWPEAGRGHVTLSESDYETAIDFLLQQDFENYIVATASTKEWIDKVASLADQLWWGEYVVGRAAVPSPENAAEPPKTANNLMNDNQVRKRKKPDEGEAAGGTEVNKRQEQPSLAAAADGREERPEANTASSQDSGVNVLSGSFIKKKKKET